MRVEAVVAGRGDRYTAFTADQRSVTFYKKEANKTQSFYNLLYSKILYFSEKI